jgi:hypothetical protein
MVNRFGGNLMYETWTPSFMTADREIIENSDYGIVYFTFISEQQAL